MYCIVLLYTGWNSLKCRHEQSERRYFGELHQVLPVVSYHKQYVLGPTLRSYVPLRVILFAACISLSGTCLPYGAHADVAKYTNWPNPYYNLLRFRCVVANKLMNGSVFAMIWYENETMYVFLRWRPLGCAPFSTVDARNIIISYYDCVWWLRSVGGGTYAGAPSPSLQLTLTLT